MNKNDLTPAQTIIVAKIATYLETELKGKISWHDMTERIITLYYLVRDKKFEHWLDVAFTFFSWESEYNELILTIEAEAMAVCETFVTDILQKD